jgi:hypothetical protein
MLQVQRIVQAALTGSVVFLASAVGQASPLAQASPAFECVLPYVSGGGMVSIVSASGEDQVVEITVMNTYRYNIVVPKNSSHTFQSPVYKDYFVPVVHGGPISFKSAQPLVVYTMLADDSVTLQCSETTKRTKIFVGSPRTGVALVNITKSPINLQIFRDSEQTPSLSLRIAPEERKLAFLQELLGGSGTHTYRVVADNDGLGIATISYERSPAAAVPIAERATP